MALISRGCMPSADTFNAAFDEAVPDAEAGETFTLTASTIEDLDDLAVKDALEIAAVDDDFKLGDGQDIELSCEQLYNMLDTLNAMYLDGDDDAGTACERILSQLGFTLV